MKKWIIVAVVIVLVGIAGFLGARAYYTKGALAVVPEQSKEVTDNDKLIQEEKTHYGDVIKEGLADIGELATEEYYYTEVQSFESSKQLKGFDLPLTKSSYIFSYDGEIKAGIDFTQISVEEDEETGDLTITIPEASILSHELDTDSFEVYDESQSIFNKTSVGDVNDSISNLKKTAEEKALKRGILNKANSNAKLMIENLVSSLVNTEEIKVIYK